MISIIGSIFCIIFYLSIFMLCGTIIQKFLKIRQVSMILSIVIGFFFYFSMFQLVSLPLKALLLPLSILSILWMALIVIICFVSFFYARRIIIDSVILFLSEIRSSKINYILMAIMIIAQILIIGLNEIEGSMWDSLYYIGEVSVSVYTNTLSQYSPYTGEKLLYLNKNYLLENYQMHSAVMCQVFKIHPLVEVRTIMTTVVIILTNLIYYLIGNHLLKGNTKKNVIMLFFVFIINFSYVSVYSSSSFFYNRTFEGKAILGNIIIPIILYLYMRIIDNYKDKNNWIFLFIVIFGGYTLNMSAMFIIPILTAACFIPLAIIKRNAGIFYKYLLCMIPSVMVIIYYILSKEGYLLIRIS